MINKFLYRRGGAEICTLETGRLLETHGHDVFYWGMQHPRNPVFMHQELFAPTVDFEMRMKFHRQLLAAGRILYSIRARKNLGAFLNLVKPDVVHLNNIAHQLSPSIIDEIAKRRIPMVMTMHDFKMVCPAYICYVGGQPCERCTNRKFYECVRNKCVKNSKMKSAVSAIEMYLHHVVGRFYQPVSVFVAPSFFLKETVQKMGFHGNVIHIPNFVFPFEFSPRYSWKNRSIVYFGRLSVEKGIRLLLESSSRLDLEIQMVGDGPMKEECETRISHEKLGNIRMRGYKTGSDLKKIIQDAMFVVLPSECYENNPRAAIEAFAMGKPVVGSGIGGIPELVGDSQRGLIFEAASTSDFVEKVTRLSSSGDEIVRMGRNARRYVEEDLSSESHYNALMNVYDRVTG